MKVPAQANYVLVYSIEEYDLLGHVIEAHIVQLTSLGNLSLVSQRIHINNADYYDKALDQDDYKALKLLSECTPEFLTKKFSKVPRIRPKAFFSKKDTQELIEKGIRPFIDNRLAQVLQLIKGKNLYLKEGKNAISEKIDWSNENSTILFHLRRNDSDIHYFPTLKYGDQRVDINRKNAFLLSASPCFLVNNFQLYTFDLSLDGNKIKPFLRKRFIRIPIEKEPVFLKSFVVPLFEEHSLYAKGYKVNNLRFVASPLARLTKLLNGKAGIVLYFKYGDYKFPYHSKKSVSVTLEKDDQSYTFNRVKRSLDWERIKFDFLINQGLEVSNGSEFSSPEIRSTDELIAWIGLRKRQFEKAGFSFEQSFDQIFNLEPNELQLDLNENRDWFDVDCKVILGGFEIPFKKLKGNIRNGNPRYKLPDGSVAIIPKEWFEQLEDLADFSYSEGGLKIRKAHAVLFNSNETGLKAPMFKVNELEPVEVPDNFNGELRTYQKAGYDWLNFLYENEFGGCLADDMGLGKTVQTLAFIQKLTDSSATNGNVNGTEQFDLFESRHTAVCNLLIVPTSLIHNWFDEAEKFTPNLKILIHQGQNRATSSESFGQYDLIISTYGTVRNDIEFLRDFDFQLVILDEAQMIKNPDSKIAAAVSDLQCVSMITLTGTPVENSVMDLWSQMNATNEGLLGNQRFFQQKFQIPIEKHKDELQLEKLKALIHPFVLRRTKQQVAKDLPDKTEQIIYCEMTETQKSLYEQVKSQYRNMLLGEIDPKELSKLRFNLLSGLTKLRLIANSSSLYEDSDEQSSGKFDTVIDRLDTALSEGHKVLIFSQFVKHLNIYSEYFDDHGTDYARIDGSMSSKQRKEQVEIFQNDDSCKVFLLSLKAGGFGLNLTAADYVFLLDPWWNPAAENQAIDRTHRIGQTQKVFSYRFITSESIEEKILALQKEKLQLSDSLIKQDESIFKSLNQSEILDLFD